MNQPAAAVSPVDPAAVVAAVRDRARDLYGPRRLFCSEAVLVAVNEVFGCGLEEGQAVALAAAMPVGLGGSGCLCGALNGAAAALGLALAMGPDPCDRKAVRQASARLHDAFKAAHGAACCRTLIKKVKDDKQAHLAQCEALTAWAAEAVAVQILALRPDLVEAGMAAVMGSSSDASRLSTSGRPARSRVFRPSAWGVAGRAARAAQAANRLHGGLRRFTKRLIRRFG